jgi:hypothetical protein
MLAQMWQGNTKTTNTTPHLEQRPHHNEQLLTPESGVMFMQCDIVPGTDRAELTKVTRFKCKDQGQYTHLCL